MPTKKRRIVCKLPKLETPTEEVEAPSLREIIPGGDVILVVGPEKSKIQISSHLLRTTSPVFNVMLGPNFKEGAALRENEGPTEIVLPEDNAQALWNVYNTLYGANPHVNKLKPDEIYDISILAQKYDLTDRLTLACEAWFGHLRAISYDSTRNTGRCYWRHTGSAVKLGSKTLA